MERWTIKFFPEYGQNHAPEAFMDGVSKIEAASIRQKLKTIRELETWEWPRWVKKVAGLYQLTCGDYRLYFDIDNDSLVICHICRKVSQKARPEDISRAKNNLKHYYRIR